MRYCVIKDTTKVVDGSTNSDDVMLQNAQSVGYTVKQVEILTQSEFDARKALEPVPEVIDADTILNAKIEVQTINTLIDLGVI